MDHTYIPLILPTAALHISLTQWQKCCSSQKSNGLFDHTLFLIYIWIRLWFHQLFFFHPLSPHFSGKEKQKRKTRSEHILTELESSESFSSACPSIYYLIIQREKWKLVPKAFVFEQREKTRLLIFKKYFLLHIHYSSVNPRFIFSPSVTLFPSREHTRKKKYIG